MFDYSNLWLFQGFKFQYFDKLSSYVTMCTQSSMFPLHGKHIMGVAAVSLNSIQLPERRVEATSFIL